jgi:predicted O-methyltransferase YrrM
VARSPDSNWGLLGRVTVAAARAAVTRRQEFRYHALRDTWSVAKRLGAGKIENVEVREVPAIQEAVVEAYIDDPNRAVLAALCRSLETRTFFEIGTNRGRTAWTVARNNPDLRVHTLDLPSKEALAEVRLGLNPSDRDFFSGDWDRGDAYRGKPEESRIETLVGDSANFDYGPYRGKMDMVFVDGAHTYDYVRNDTKAALEMLSPEGAIAWDDYPAIPGVYTYLAEFSRTADHPLYHIRGTRLVVYSRKPFVVRLSPEEYGRLDVA